MERVRRTAGEAADPGLSRGLGRNEALSLIVGRIIGSGIFRTPGPIMALTVGAPLFFGVWALAGVATLLGALCYAELVAMLPRSGGPYAYLRAAYPPWWAFLRGWAMFFVSETAAIAAVALVFAEYGQALWGAATGAPAAASWPAALETAVAVLAVWALTGVNVLGVRTGGVVQNVLTLLKLGALAAVAAVCLTRAPGAAAAVGGALGAAAAGAGDAPAAPSGWAAVAAAGAAMRYAFFAFSGWEGATYVAEEVREPSRNLPRSLLVGIGVVFGVYLLANAAYLHQLGAAGMAGSKQVAADAVRAAAGPAGAALVALAVVLSTFGNVNAQVLVKARTWHAMARDGLFPAALGRVHARRRTPVGALVAQGTWATALLVAAGLAGRAYESVVDFFAFTSAVFNISTFAAVWVLRRRHPDWPRPFRVPGWPWTLLVVLAIQAWFLVTTAVTAPLPSALGALLTLAGLAWYRLRVAGRERG